MCHKQLDSLAAVLDDRLVYIHSSGWMETKTDMINDLSSGKLIMNKVTVNEATADYFKDNTVIVHGKGVFTVTGTDGKIVDINLYYTEVYIKRRATGCWLPGMQVNFLKIIFLQYLSCCLPLDRMIR